MLRISANSAVLGSTLPRLAAMALFCVAGRPFAAAQRPSYPIAREFLVRQDCDLLMAPDSPGAKSVKARFRHDATICHLETIDSSRHMEESIQGGELHRARVEVREQEYVLENISDDPEVFVVEQNVPRGWQVDSDPQPVELIPASGGEAKANRDLVAVFRVYAKPGEAVRLHVGERRTTPLKTRVLRASATGAGGF